MAQGLLRLTAMAGQRGCKPERWGVLNGDAWPMHAAGCHSAGQRSKRCNDYRPCRDLYSDQPGRPGNFEYSVVINGAAMGATIIDANHLDRGLQVQGVTLNLSDLSIQNGQASPGGALLVAGSASINQVAFNSNQAPSTGPTGVGGAVFVDAGGTATITSSQFTGNWQALGVARSAVHGSGALFIDSSTFTANSGGLPGGGAVYPNNASTTIANSTFINNHADVGGGIHSNAASVTVANSTFVSNSATNSGAIDSRIGLINVNNSTFFGNTVTGGVDIGLKRGKAGSSRLRIPSCMALQPVTTAVESLTSAII